MSEYTLYDQYNDLNTKIVNNINFYCNQHIMREQCGFVREDEIVKNIRDYTDNFIKNNDKAIRDIMIGNIIANGLQLDMSDNKTEDISNIVSFTKELDFRLKEYESKIEQTNIREDEER